MNDQPALSLLRPGDAFPPLAQAWPADSPAPGLIAVGGALDVPTLVAAYSATIFPWFSPGEPVLWWSPDPRMVLATCEFRLHRSLRKTLQRFRADPACSIRVDNAFDEVVLACAEIRRPGQRGTWIDAEMRQAYGALHRAGHAHSVETWVDGELVAGLYCVNIGRAVFGESMFSTLADGSKIALAALVAFCREHRLPAIDCQQNTRHLRSLGAREIARAEFAHSVRQLAREAAPRWHFEPVYWNAVLSPARPNVDAP